MAFLLEDIAVLATLLGQSEVAFELLGATARQLGSTLSIQEAIESGLRFTRRHGSEK